MRKESCCIIPSYFINPRIFAHMCTRALSLSSSGLILTTFNSDDCSGKLLHVNCFRVVEPTIFD
jgi:hypothetical protein